MPQACVWELIAEAVAALLAVDEHDHAPCG
jgi:hypothetical protein